MMAMVSATLVAVYDRTSSQMRWSGLSSACWAGGPAPREEGEAGWQQV